MGLNNMVHLHVHTKYSLLDGMMHIEDIATRLKEIEQDTIAITEHGNLYSSVEAYSKLSKEGIKVIEGCEVYICDDVNVKSKDSKYYHLILLCKNETGRQNLNWLVSQSTLYKYYGKPRIDFDMLKNHHEGLICLSACMAGEVQRALMNDSSKSAEQIALKYKKLFGDDYYIETQAHSGIEQQTLNAQLIDLANRLNIKYTVTCDSHYVRKEDQKYHNVFVQIGTSREAGETYDDCYLQSEEDVIRNSWKTQEYIEQAIKTTHEIADKCENTIPLSAPIIPHVPVPSQYKSELQYLQYLCNEGFKRKGFSTWTYDQWKNYLTDKVVQEDGTIEEVELVHFTSAKEIKNKYIQRARYEMNALKEMGFEGYYLLVYSYVNAAKRRGIARGSGGGSLLAYLCGIVDIDPIKYGLYFERFIDVGALDLLKDGTITKKELKIPDFDVDFSPNDRDKVMNFIVDRYGEQNVVSLGQFSYLWAKGAIKDIGRVLNIPFEITNEITKNLDNETIEEAINLGLLDAYKDKYPELFEYASRLSGLPKSFGVHPCFPKDSLVLTENGYKAIQDVQIGDKVFTHNSNYQTVVNTMTSRTNQLITIDACGTLPIKCTPNHPFYVRHRIHQNPKKYSKPEWVEAKDIVKTDMIALPINCNNEIPIYENIPTNQADFWWIVGRYVGDGWLKKKYPNRRDSVITICCNKNEQNEITNVLDRLGTYNYWIDNERTVDRINIANKYLYSFLQLFGSGADGKYLPQLVLNLPTYLLSAFIDGYLSADGYVDNNGFYSFTAVSKLLVLGMVQCVAKVYHQACTVCVVPAHIDIIEGRTVNAKEKYKVLFSKTRRTGQRNFVDGDILWLFTRKTSTEQNACNVYNLSVTNDNTYTVNNIAVHNCGKVIATREAMYYNATEYNDGKNTWVLEGDMHSADDLGLVKIDLLSIRTLDVIYDVLDMIGKDYNYIAPHILNMNDPVIWNEFAQGNTDCIFQFESSGMKRMLKDMKCNTMENLSAANALYRPGSKNFIPNYINRKNGVEKIEYIHQDLEPILKNSYGIIIFQEQLIEIGRLAGLRNPDELRKATAKKKPKLMAKIEPELKGGLMNRGWQQEQVDELWETILRFASYSFNKSHSSAYAITAYLTMYLKVYHTVEFFCACINSYDGDIDNIVKTIKEAKRMGVTVKYDDWNKIEGKTTCRDGVVYLGINTIKGCGENVSKALKATVDECYDDFFDLLCDFNNCPDIDNGQIETLIRLGFFSQFGGTFKLLRIYGIFNLYHGKKIIKKEKLLLPIDLVQRYAISETAKQYRFDDTSMNAMLKEFISARVQDEDIPLNERLQAELEYLGYISYTDPTLTNTGLVLDVDSRYSPKISLYLLDKGETVTYKLQKSAYQKNPFDKGTILRFYTEERNKSRKTENGWEKLPDKETWLTNYIVKSNL